jgi:hypothetical protein
MVSRQRRASARAVVILPQFVAPAAMPVALRPAAWTLVATVP